VLKRLLSYIKSVKFETWAIVAFFALAVLALVSCLGCGSSTPQAQQQAQYAAPQPQTEYVQAPPTYGQPAVVAAPAPVIVQAAPAPSNDGLVTGMLLGHMLSGGGGGGYVHHTTVVNKTVINRYSPPPRPTYTPRPSYSSPSSFRGYSSRRR
jgi:hypothetical protein